MIDTNNDAAIRAEAERRSVLRANGIRHFDLPPIPIPAADSRALEKEIEAQCDKLMLALGFEVVRLSQARASKVHPGLPDRRFYRRPRVVDRPDGRFCTPALAVWVELKSATGKQRPDQRAFQEMVHACSESYICGGVDAVVQWLVAQRLGTVVNGAFEPTEGG